VLEHDEKRNYIRMGIDCDITFKLPNSDQRYQGRCTSISGAGVSFTADRYVDPGKAMEINVEPRNAATPTMTAFIEVVRSTQLVDNLYEIAATIKSIKGN